MLLGNATQKLKPKMPARKNKKKSTTWKAKLGCSGFSKKGWGVQCSIYTKKKKNRHNKIVKADETVNALTCKSKVRSKIQNSEPLTQISSMVVY